MSKKFNITRGVSHEILFFISLGFSLLQFVGFGNWLVAQIIFGALGFASEIEKRYLSRKVKRDFIDKKWGSFAGNVALLVVIVSLSCLAAFGAMRSSLLDRIEDITVIEQIEEEVIAVDVDNVNFRIAQIDRQIEAHNITIDVTNNELQKMNQKEVVYVPSLNTLNNTIKENNEAINLLLDERGELSALLNKVNIVEESTETNRLSQYLSSSKTFQMLADDFGWEFENVMRWVLYFLIFVLEGSLFITVKPLDGGEVEVKRDEKELFEKFIYELFNNNGRKYLNSVNKACAGAGVSSGQGKTWMAMLLEIKMRGSRPLISKESGGYISSFPVSTVVNVAKKALFMEEV